MFWSIGTEVIVGTGFSPPVRLAGWFPFALGSQIFICAHINNK